MNNVTIETEKKSVVLKSLAILGLIFIISFIAWLSVRIVAIAPSAFSSLASLASGIGDAREEIVEEMSEPEVLVVTSTVTDVAASEPVVINWDKVDATGTYAFRYQCIDGVSIEVTGVDGFRNISCDTSYNLGDAENLTLIINSSQTRFADIAYSVSFIKTNATSPSFVGENKLTVSNLAIVDPTAPVEEPVEETPVVPETPVATPTLPPVVAQEEFVFEIPVSNPNGIPDLTARFLTIGDIVNNRFVAGTVEQNETGAVQFEIRNIGNKTSESWTFTVELPDGSEYTSTTQTPLRPNERAVLALSFEADGGSTFTFEVEVETDEDRTEANNRFRQVVAFR
jgi:hypothetical protein